MTEIEFTHEFEKRYAELPLEIQKRAEKQEGLFRQNPFYPSLHTEKLEPKARQVWSLRVDKSYRILFKFLGREKVVFLTIGPHDWIYKQGFK